MEHLLQGLNGVVVTKFGVKLLDETPKMFIRYINVSYIRYRGSEICSSIYGILVRHMGSPTGNSVQFCNSKFDFSMRGLDYCVMAECRPLLELT